MGASPVEGTGPTYSSTQRTVHGAGMQEGREGPHRVVHTSWATGPVPHQEAS